MRLLIFSAVILGAVLATIPSAGAVGDLTRQEPVLVKVELGTVEGAHKFEPNDLTFETGKLYKLVLTNPSKIKHYFTSPGLAARVFTRKVQVVTDAGSLAEIKGHISEIEVYPGATAEWWFVPIATGKFNDLHCHIKDSDGETHAKKGMTGSITIN